LRRLFRQFSFPGGIPSHVAPETPGSIHEGGELGYSLSHAYGAAFDNPGAHRRVRDRRWRGGDGPLATSWHSNKFLNPARDGAVLPILHLNGYKIGGPTVLARIPRDELTQLLSGYGYEPHYVDHVPDHPPCTRAWPARSIGSWTVFARSRRARDSEAHATGRDGR
jgi:xylulose-5-phosphate/fructose-6-phosphate phosphoketolase